MAEKEGEKKSSFVAAIFSIIFVGAGFIYLGHYKRFAFCFLSALVIGALSIIAIPSFGIPLYSEFGRLVLFLVLISFQLYVALVTKKVGDSIQAKPPVQDTFAFWETEKPGQSGDKEAEQKPGEGRLSMLGLVTSAVIAVVVLFAFGPVAALFTLAILLVLTYIGKVGY